MYFFVVQKFVETLCRTPIISKIFVPALKNKSTHAKFFKIEKLSILFLYT